MAKFKRKIITYFIFILSFIVINSEEPIRILNFEYENGLIITINEYEDDNDKFEIEYTEFFPDDFGYIIPAYGWGFLIKGYDTKNMSIVFDEIFKDTDIHEISVKNEELTEKQNEIILKFLDDHKIAYKLQYEIINNVNYYNQTYKERGYSYEFTDNGLVITISMGEKPTRGDIQFISEKLK